MSFGCQKGEFDRSVEESRPHRQPDRPIDPTGADRPDRFSSLTCKLKQFNRGCVSVIDLCCRCVRFELVDRDELEWNVFDRREFLCFSLPF